MINIVLFCGGRGSKTIIQELLRHQEIHLTLLVNAYDDGLSTGILRDFISEMLGPSDFRKNLSYLLDPFSEEQYALKRLLEFRFSKSISSDEINNLIEFIKSDNYSTVNHSLKQYFQTLSYQLSKRIRNLLSTFFYYAEIYGKKFDYRDCSIGNLIFAGAYLQLNEDFNAATKEMNQLVTSRGLLINVSEGKNRILVALKADGQLLSRESAIVDSQSIIPIRNIFLIKTPINQAEWEAYKDFSIEKKEAWLQQQESLPSISREAEKALAEADIIIYGPGTQYSSLFPSYKIVQAHLLSSPALVKTCVMNLEMDYDIQSYTVSDIINQALFYMGDIDNLSSVVTHILLDNTARKSRLINGELIPDRRYKNSSIISGEFANTIKQRTHNGRVVIEQVLAIYKEATMSNHCENFAIHILVDIHKRSLELDALIDEVSEIDWKTHFTSVQIDINNACVTSIHLSESIKINHYKSEQYFPEVDYFYHWLRREKSEYLLLMVGDGEYRFRDVLLAMNLLEKSNFGAVYGSRNQSRMQFKLSLQAAYGEKKLLRFLSFLGAYMMSIIFAFRFGIILSDPLTGFCLFKRSRIINKIPLKNKRRFNTSVSIITCLVANNIEIAEIPVSYRTFSGFSDPKWRIFRGLKNLFSMILT
jgi:2-phospho-L-lactate transferase/gluconeogenesis factor (CofD/UPF0052 family)